MANNRARFFSHTKRFLFSATTIILTLSVFLQTLVVARSPSVLNNAPSTATKAENRAGSLAHPLVTQPLEIANNEQRLMADCSSQTALRREISNRWRFFAQPIPPFLPGIGIPGINRKARKAYEELYWSARTLEEIGKQLLREARKATDHNLLSSACSILNQVLQIQNEITGTDADAVNLWNNSLTNTYNRVKRIRDLCLLTLQIGTIAGAGGIPLLVLGILNSLFREMTDNALFQANLPPETYTRIIIFDVIIPILLQIRVAKWNNRTFSEHVTKKITLPTLVKNPPGFVKLIKEAFRFYLGELRPALDSKITARLAGIITEAQIEILVSGLNSRLGQYINESNNSQRPELDSSPESANAVADNGFLTMLEIIPAGAATEVNTSLPTVTIGFSEMIQAVNIQAQLFHQNGSTVPLNGGIIGDTLFFNLGSSLQPNTSYTMRLQAGSIRGTESGALNQELEWSFVTDTASLTNGSSALVTNTGVVGLRLRNSPGTSAGIITTLSEGTRLTVTGNSVQSDGYTWYPVQTQNGQTGWSATGNWLTAVDQYGFRPGGEVQVSNTSGFGLRLRVEAGESSPIITVLSEGTTVKLTGEPVFVDGYSWFPIQTSDGTQGYSAIARWLIPYSQSAAGNLVIRTISTSTSAKLDWGQSTTYDFYVSDGNGLPVSGATVGGQNNLIGNIFIAESMTDANGRTSYTTTVPAGRDNGQYSVIATATRGGFSNSLPVTRTVEVSHGCSYQVHATDSMFSAGGGSGSLSIITQPGCGWSVPQYPGFVSLTSPDSGVGDGEVTFFVSANSSSSMRTGNMVVAGASVSINQEGAPATVQVSIGTDPDGLTFTVDGQTYTSRQSFAWSNGSTHTVSTSSPQAIGVNQFNFSSWSDAGAQSHTIIANANQTLTARFELPANTNVALDYSWQTRAVSIYHGFSATAVTPGDGFIYILGGSENSTRFSRFDPVSNTWTALPSIPGEGTFEGAAAALDGKIYVFGNYFNAAMRTYDIASGQWLSGTRMGPYPFPTRGISFISTGGSIYAVGGTNMNLEPVAGLKRYNQSSDTWTQLADMPSPRGFAATALIDNRIYVAGGNGGGNGVTSVNVYDLQSNTWSVGTPLPQTRILAAAVAVNSRLLVIGGSNGTFETRSVLEYNTVSDVWRELSPFNQARYGAVGAFLRGKLYVIGGTVANLEEGTPSAWAPVLSFGQAFNALSGNRYGFFDLHISSPSNSYTPITLMSSDTSKISFPYTYTLSPGQTSIQITFKTGSAGGPVTITAELPDNLARVRGYKQITVSPGTASAETQAATDVTSNSAALNGTVNPSGSQTNAFFELGTDSNLNNPQATTQVNAGDGLTPVTVMFPLVNLQSGTTYYYRMAATNAAGTTRSAIQSFTTYGPPLSIGGQVTINGTAQSGVTITLSGPQPAMTTTTDASGAYSFTGLASGSNYTITPSLQGYVFIPASRSFSNLSGNQTANFDGFRPLASRAPADFDGDGKTDISVWQSGSGKWHIINSSDASVRLQFWGESSLGDVAVPGDYDGDGTTDIAIFRSTEGNWYILQSSDGASTIHNWGQQGDKPVAADYDGDGKTDTAVYRPSDGNWYIRKSSGGSIAHGWGDPTDKLVPGDYDGDGKADIAVFRPLEGNWYILHSTGGLSQPNWGLSEDKPVPGDYDGDGKTDVAVFRLSEGNWYIRKSSGGALIRNWGDATDRPVPGDYDGDGKTDIAVWRPGESTWYVIQSSNGNGIQQYLGSSNDTPLPSAYLPQ